MVRELRPLPSHAEDRSLGELFGDLSRETSTLIRQEAALAKAELKQKAAHAGKDAGFLVAGGLLAYAGLLALVATAVIVLASFLPWWLSALIVGVAVTGAGGVLAMRGLSGLKKGDANPVPQQTIKTIRDDLRWAKEQTK